MIGRIGIVGSGFIGRAWAIVFARAGYEARLYDADRRRRDQRHWQPSMTASPISCGRA